MIWPPTYKLSKFWLNILSYTPTYCRIRNMWFVQGGHRVQVVYVAIFLVISRACLNTLHIAKVSIIYSSQLIILGQLLLTIEQIIDKLLEHIVQYLLYTCLLVSTLRSTSNHIQVLFEMSNHIRHDYQWRIWRWLSWQQSLKWLSHNMD